MGPSNSISETAIGGVRARRRLAFVSSVLVPHQVAFCSALQDHLDARFWFYEYPDRTRGSWWRVDGGDRCQVLEGVLFAGCGSLGARYLARGLVRELERFDPDILMIGGFSIPSNYLAYRWALRTGRRTVVFTERSRDRQGRPRSLSFAWRVLRWMYRDVDLVLASAEDAVPQFRDILRFGDKVEAAGYAADLEAYFGHPLREARGPYTYLFANRMTAIYNPLGAIELFAAVHAKYPGSKLVMNAAGELGEACRAFVARLGLEDRVEFLTGLTSWRELHLVYARCDILLLPAIFSNGNFTILEAMASGMGLVVSDRVLGIGTLIEDGHNGFRCPPSTEAFLDRIDRYVRQPELLKAHALINRQLSMPHSAPGAAQHLVNILNRRLPR